jgi:hypothetical protein
MTPHRQPSNSPPRTALIVVGVGRSGTSALTRVLNLLGAALPRNIMPPGRINETGFWEPAWGAALHDEILSGVGSSFDALNLPDESWFDSPQAGAYVGKIKEIVRREYGDAPLIIVKDPRISLLFPLWSRALSELNIACKPIVAVRNPMEVAQSLCRASDPDGANEEWHVDRGGLMALRFNVSAERWTRPYRRAFCHFNDLLGDWRGVARRLSRELGVAWPDWSPEAEIAIDAFLRSSRRHHVASDDVASFGGIWTQLINPVYSSLRRACSGDPVDTALFDGIGAAYSALYSIFAQRHACELKRSEHAGDARSVQALQRQITLLTESTSWRVTAPLRLFTQNLRGRRRGFRWALNRA